MVFWSLVLVFFLIVAGVLWAIGFGVGVRFSVAEWSDNSTPALEALIRDECRAHVVMGKSPGLVVGVVREGKKSLMGFGRSTLAFGAPVTGDTLFEIGSITKTFTGLLLAKAVEEGRVTLDQPLYEVLDVELSAPASAITLRHLTTHTSGLPTLPFDEGRMIKGAAAMLIFGADPYDGLTAGDYLDSLRRVSLEFPPGTKVEYSNFAVTMLGYALARHAGRPYEEMVKTDICLPLGMTETTLQLEKGQAARFATGYRVAGKVSLLTYGLRSHPWNDEGDLGGAGGVRSSGHDMLRYLEANLVPGSSPLSAALKRSHEELFQQNKHTAWGMNWVRSTGDVPGVKTIWHNGATGGFCCYLGFTEDGRNGVVVMANSSHSVDELGQELLAKLARTTASKPVLP